MTLPEEAAQAVISFQGIGRTYPGPPAVDALGPVDLTIRGGDYLTVVGPSGSGKSTFLNIAGLLDRPSYGHYELDGIDVGALTEAQRTALRGQRIGFVFQSFHLLAHRSAVENVMLALLYRGVSRAERQERALEALERVGLAHRAWAMPSTLSGGECQRVAIARALVGHPSLLLCDEPTGNLDSRTTESVLDLFDAVYAAGQTLVIITHDPIVAARGHRQVLIRDGRLTEVSAAGEGEAGDSC